MDVGLTAKTANRRRLTANCLYDCEEGNVPVTVRFYWRDEAQIIFF